MAVENIADTESELLFSAKEFLVEALRDYRAEKLTFAVVHAMIAVELLLKERLKRIHPVLIYENIDSKNLDRAKTVSMGDVPRRLTNLDVQLDLNDVELIHLLRQWRNDVVHHMPGFDLETAKHKLVRLFDFLASFTRRELDVPLKDILPSDLYKFASETLSGWQVDVEKAREAARVADYMLEKACPDCGATGVLSLNPMDDVYCHLCNSDRYCFFHCVECGRGVLETSFNN